MAQVLRLLHDSPAICHPDLVIGITGADDAGVYRISDDVALVQTVDFFTPIVDDPGDWGRIAAANALSDVYAMGGRPVTALQMVGWPRGGPAFDVAAEVVAGGASVLEEAACTLVGGHSIDNPVPAYGFAITGVVDPRRIVANRGAHPGDALVLTKPIGTGVIATAVKRGVAAPGVVAEAVRIMTHLNAGASRAMVASGVTAATDVTGFGLLGHLGEMLAGVGAEIEADSVPVLPGAAELASSGVVPGGTERNRSHAEGFVEFRGVGEVLQTLLCDAQTSGGLLMAVPQERVADLLARLADEDTPAAAQVGRFVAEVPGRVVVR